jgi:hypothetical protein
MTSMLHVSLDKVILDRTHLDEITLLSVWTIIAIICTGLMCWMDSSGWNDVQEINYRYSINCGNSLNRYFGFLAVSSAEPNNTFWNKFEEKLLR